MMRLSVNSSHSLYEKTSDSRYSMEPEPWLFKDLRGAYEYICHEPSTDEYMMTDQVFTSEKNDIKPKITSGKFVSLTEDLLNDHLSKCIHKNDLHEMVAPMTESSKQEIKIDSIESTGNVDEDLHTADSSVPSSNDIKPSMVFQEQRVKKGLPELIERAGLQRYLPEIDQDFDVEELYRAQACDLETVLEEVFWYMKPGHKSRLAIVVLEERGEFKRQGLLKMTENGILNKKLDGEEVEVEAKKLPKLPKVEDWLQAMNMEKYKENFIGTGYDDYEFLMLMMCTEHFMLNDI